jgi:transcriptional regulator with XRE-family HTH domain
MELAGYSEIGNVLRTAREDRHLSLPDVARMLHIRARYLEALEKGDFTELPGLPYAKGYIQAYAVFLELDKDEIMRRFERVDAQINKRNFQLPKAFHSDKKPHQAAIWGSLIAVLVLYSLWQISASSEEKTISIIEQFELHISPEMQRYAKKAFNPACFHLQEKLYPPCHIVPVDEGFKLIPLQGYPSTVLALWDNTMAEGQRSFVMSWTAPKPVKQVETNYTRPDDDELSTEASDLPEG